jgi:nucleoside-diphosphate-sugar epimerase
VGSLVLPHLAKRHELRVFDLKPPRSDVDVEYVGGDLRDFDALLAAASGCDALLFMAMGPMSAWGSPEGARQHFDVAAGGLYLALLAAHEVGITHAVYTSSMSVFSLRGHIQREAYPDESAEPDATGFYGLAKRFGELVCQNAVLEYGMSVVALRLCFPVSDEEFPITDNEHRGTICTSARDVAAAIQAGLDYRGHGFEAFGISGDAAERMVSIRKARDLLGWSPLDPTSPAPGQ